MATKESSTFWGAELLGYARERLLRARVLLLAAAVALCSGAASASREAAVWTQAVAAAVGLVWAFRLWDDLADLAYDRIHHPERKLVSSTTRPSFAAALGIVLAAAVGALVLAERPRQALALGLLCAFLAAVYLPWRGRVDRRLMRAHLVLAKYPVFIYVAAVRPVSTTVAMIAGAAYLALCVIEILDDPALRRTVAARVLAAAEAVAFVGIVAAGALR